jgi:colanic acid biosynthesis glycosyl transferase WcaI
LRLLVVSQYFWPENFRINELVADLVGRGHEVTVLTGRPNYPEGQVFDEFGKDPDSFDRYEGATVLRVPLRPRGKGRLGLTLNYLSFVFWGTLLGPWLLRGRRFDSIFVFATSPVTAALPALLLRRLKRAPLAIWVLDLWPETLCAVGAVRSRLLLACAGALVSFIYRRCDRILVQSKAFFPNILHWSGDGSRTRYCPNWVEKTFEIIPDVVAPAPEVLAHRDTFNVMFAGNIGEAQDFPAILEAAGLLRHRSDLRWLIVGDGRAADSVRAEIERRGLQGCVVLLGRHPVERMPSFLCAAGALLVSLRTDPVFAMTIPGKVQTYLAAGVPVLGMLDGEGARVIEESGAGFVCPSGASGLLASHVEHLLSLTAQERLAMGRRGQAFCRSEFGRERLISRIENSLLNLAGQAARPDFADSAVAR